MSEKVILALDLGTSTGFAVTGPTHVLGGTVRLDLKANLATQRKTRSDRRSDIRVLFLFDWLTEMIVARKPDVVIFEDVKFARSQAQAHLWASLRGAVWCACHANRVERVDCLDTGKLKIFATANGHADKAVMADTLVRIYSLEFKRTVHGIEQIQTGQIFDDNAIDAFFLHRWAHYHYV